MNQSNPTSTSAYPNGSNREFKIRPTRCICWLAALVAACVATAATSSGWWLTLAITLLLPGFRATTSLLLGRVKLTPTGLELGRQSAIAYEDLIGIRSRLAIDGVRKASITIYTTRGRTIIPAGINPDSQVLYRELVQRVAVASIGRHAAATDKATWPAYDEAPPELQDLVDRSREQHVEQQAFLFRGRVRKAGMLARSLPILVALSLITGVTAHALTPNAIAISIPAGIVGIGSAIAAFASWTAHRRREWLCVHAGGIAMVGSQITGELHWDDIESITTARERSLTVSGSEGGGAGAFYVTSFDGARIPVCDHYDCPLPVVMQLAQRMSSGTTTGAPGPDEPVHTPSADRSADLSPRTQSSAVPVGD